MKKILLLQSYASEEERNFELQCYRNAFGGGAELVLGSTLDETLPWNKPGELLAGFDAVVLSGSSEFDFDGGRPADDPVLAGSRAILARLRPLVEYVIAHEFPCFGVCFGHQIIAGVHGAEVHIDREHNNFGSYETLLTTQGIEDPVFAAMPGTFVAQYYNKDVVVELPREAVLLGQSGGVRHSILRYGRACYTTQFHPELTMQDTADEFRRTPGLFPRGQAPETFIKPSPEAGTILARFLARIA